MNLVNLGRAVLAARPQSADHWQEDPYPHTWARRSTTAPARRWPLLVRVMIWLAQATAIYCAALAGFVLGLCVRILVWG
jgi:hypothetical protein